MGGLVNQSWANTAKVRPTAIFDGISDPYSDGGSYAIYRCRHCRREFYGGDGVRRLPNGDRVVQCPRCQCVDESWRKSFQKHGLVEKAAEV